MRTTSHPGPSKSRKSGGIQAPLKSIRLRVDLDGAGFGDLKRLAVEKGVALEERGETVSLVLEAPTAEKALEQLRLLASLLAPGR